MASHIKSMTEGKPGKLILTFALPLMAGNVFQQLYTVFSITKRKRGIQNDGVCCFVLS